MTDESTGGRKDTTSTFRAIFDKLTQVRIITVVGDVKVSVRTENDGSSFTTEVTPVPAADTQALITVFDLVDGDVTSVISPALLNETALRTFHSEQVERSIRVLPDHVRALVTIGEELLDR